MQAATAMEIPQVYNMSWSCDVNNNNIKISKHSAHSLRFWHVWERKKHRLPGHFNHGILNINHFGPRFALSIYMRVLDCVTNNFIIDLQITHGRCGFRLSQLLHSLAASHLVLTFNWVRAPDYKLKLVLQDDIMQKSKNVDSGLYAWNNTSLIELDPHMWITWAIIMRWDESTWRSEIGLANVTEIKIQVAFWPIRFWISGARFLVTSGT